MTMPKNLITGKSSGAGIARLMQSQPATDSDLKRAAQLEPGSVCPAFAVGDDSDDSDEELSITLPFPPSMNSYWTMTMSVHGQRIIIVSKAGREYQNSVAGLVAIRWRRPAIDYRISMLIEAWAPSDQYAEGARWEWDVDNRVKPLQDALANAGVMVNDKLVRDVRIVDRGIDPPGRVVVSIRRFRGY